MGAGLVAARDESSLQVDREMFANKQRCEQLGKQYENDHNISGVTIETVVATDYSTNLHSCVGEFFEQHQTQSSTMQDFIIIDLTTKRLFGGTICDEAKDCASRSNDMRKDMSQKFEQATAGQLSPLN